VGDLTVILLEIDCWVWWWKGF